MADLLAEFGFTHQAMLGQDGNTNRMIHRDGQRSVLVHINRRLEQDPEEADAAQAERSYV